MLPQDHACWYRFLDKYGRLFKRLWYDVWVGGPWLTPEEEKDPLKRAWQANTVKRIDALAELEDCIWIMEVATYPGQRSLGQLFDYQVLWLEDPKIDKLEILVIVCAGIDPDIAITAAKHGVRIYVV